MNHVLIDDSVTRVWANDFPEKKRNNAKNCVCAVPDGIFNVATRLAMAWNRNVDFSNACIADRKQYQQNLRTRNSQLVV